MSLARISKNQSKFLHSLKQKKYRQKYNKYGIEGHKIISELIDARANFLDMVVVTEKGAENYQSILANFQGEVLITGDKNMAMISQLKNHQDVYALCSIDETLQISEESITGKKSQGRFLFLEDIQDPGNVGTMIRTADWYGFDGVILSKNSVEVFNSKVIQSSMGSVFRIPHVYTDLNTIKQIDSPKIATTLSGSPLTTFRFPDNFVLMMGNEGKGLTDQAISLADENLLIADSFTKGAESLNVAISAGILMHYSRC